MIFINFKTYEQGTGQKAVELVHKLCDCQGETGVPVIPVVQVVDVRIAVQASDHEVWVQHTDGVEYGQFTGWILPEAIKEAEAKGAFLNHSENKKDMADLTTIVGRCREVGLKTLVFAADLEELKEILELRPDYVSYEPPGLIASRETSVARAKPEVIGKAAALAKEAGIPLVVGAGVKDVEDIRVSREQGAVGVVVSSAVVLADDPKGVVLSLAEGFK